MSCCELDDATLSWTTILKVGLQYQKYEVQLKRIRPRNCCGGEQYEIFVNGRELEDHRLCYNNYSPFCCMNRGGSYEWDQDGHTFLLMLNTLSCSDCFGEFRLFVDGIDVESGKEFSKIWRRKGIITLIIGLVLLIVITLIYVVVFVIVKAGTNGIGGVVGGTAYLTGYGFVLIIFGIILLVKYSNKPRATPSAVQDYQYNQAQVV